MAARSFAVSIAWCPIVADAHLVETGFGDFYDGSAHVVLTPSDLMVVVALALLGGQRGTRAARWALFALPAAWLIGGVVGAALPRIAALPGLTTVSFGVAGACVALNARLPASGVVLFATIAGLLHGYVNGASMMSGGATLLAMVGAAVTAFCLFAILSAQIATVRTTWGTIAIRVAGSWLAAAGILMLGWLARG